MQNKSFLFKFALYFIARVLLNHMDQELHLLLFFMSIIKSADDQICHSQKLWSVQSKKWHYRIPNVFTSLRKIQNFNQNKFEIFYLLFHELYSFTK